MTINPNDPFGAERDDKDYAGKNLVKPGLSAPLFKPPPGHTYLFRTPSLEKEWQETFAKTATPPSPSLSASGPETSPEPAGFPTPPAGLSAASSGKTALSAAPEACPGAQTAETGKDAASFHTGQAENVRPTGLPEPIAKPPETSSMSVRRDTGLSPAASPAPADRLAGETALSGHAGHIPQTAAPTETGDIRFPGISDGRWQTLGRLLVHAMLRHRAATGGNRPAVSSGGFKTPVPVANRAASGFLRTGYTPAAKQPKPVTGNSLPVNPDNPLCEPLPIRPLDENAPTIAGRRYVEAGPSREINALLTLANACRAIGINHPQVSHWEGGGRTVADVPYRKGQINNKSGVTVASGLDIGQRKEPAELRRLGLPEKLVRKLAPYLGKQRGDAVTALAKNPLSLTDEEIDLISRATMQNMSDNARKQWDAKVDRERRRHPNAPYFHELTSDQQTLLFSRFYQNGSFEKRHQAFFEAVMENDWETAANALKSEAKNDIDNSAKRWRGNRLLNEVEWYNKVKHSPQ